MRGHPRLRRALLREQPVGPERPAHEPRARLRVDVLADEQAAARRVDRRVGEAQRLARRAVARDLGQRVAVVALARRCARGASRSNRRRPFVVSVT